MCTVSMRAQHELLHVDACHLWLTRQENRGKRSQNHDAKLTRPFLRVGRGWLARLSLVFLLDQFELDFFTANTITTGTTGLPGHDSRTSVSWLQI